MEKIKKYDNVLLWIGITIISAIIIFQVPITVGDEIWNFQNIYKMVNGYTIYQQANVIITPIFFWIGELLLKWLGANYFIYRLFNACIYSSMILIIYNILKQLGVGKRKSFLYTLILYYFVHTIITGGANYNVLAITFVLLGINISLKYHGTNRFILLNGIMMYVILFTKQNIGVYYAIGTIIMQVLVRKKAKRQNGIDIAKQIAIATILSGITLGIFAVNGNLMDFINYAFLGIGEFGNNNVALEIMCVVHMAVALITILCAIFIQKKIANEEQKRNITIFLWIGIPMGMVVYPIMNAFHTMLAILPLAVLLMYLADMVVGEFLNKKITNIVIGFMVLVLVLIAGKAMLLIPQYHPFALDYQNPYYGGFLPEETKQTIQEVNQYMKEQDNRVIIFSKEAALYNIPEKRSNGAMDLPFLGNLGYGGEEGMLEQIKSKVGYQILLTKENYWQESDYITNYMREHYLKIGEIKEFEIYQIK